MTHSYARPEISLDQQIALRSAATRLAQSFEGTFRNRDGRAVSAFLL